MSNHSDSSVAHAGPSAERYRLSPVSTVSSSPTSPPTPSAHWPTAYASRDSQARYTYPPPTERLHHETIYGASASYPTYTSQLRHYSQPSSNSAYSSSRSQLEDYIPASTSWSQSSIQHDASGEPPFQPKYEDTTPDSGNFQSCVSTPTVISPQPMTPVGSFKVRCL